MLEKGQLVQHKNVSLLARVEGPDPDNKKRVMIKPLNEEKAFSCAIENLLALGSVGKT